MTAASQNVPGRTAMLMVMLDPPEPDERELHDWYDLEHVPERARIEGFRTLQRYVCLEGWPRYMALYDLDHLGILSSPAYAAVAGPNFSPWSKRVIGGARGWTRVEAEQIYPGRALAGSSGPALRTAVIRVRGAREDVEHDLLTAFETFLAQTPGVLQFRVFRSAGTPGGDCYALVELSVPIGLSGLDWGRLRLSQGYVDLANMYSRYWRRET